MRVDILLPTYQGGRYLAAQLDSILFQTYSDWVVRWSDDGSTDDTVAILERYSLANPGRFIRNQAPERQGSSRHFLWLMSKSEAPWVMFCDQDDVWMPHKIAATLNVLTDVEASIPALAFTDMRVTDAHLKVLQPSFTQAQKLQPEKILSMGLAAVCAQSMAAGCTMMLNRAACAVIPSMADYPYQHDHWLVIHVMAHKGLVHYLPLPTMDYRQHGSNEVGAKAVNWQYLSEKAVDKTGFREQWKKGYGFLPQAPSRWKVLYFKLILNLMRW